MTNGLPELPPAPPPSSLSAREVMRGNRSRDTKPEAALRSALHRRGLRFRKQIAPVAELRCRADIVFPRARVAVFVDGCFWHGCPLHGFVPRTNMSYWRAKLERNRARDRRDEAALKQAGWAVVRVWEHEPPEEAAARVEAAVRAARARTPGRGPTNTSAPPR